MNPLLTFIDSQLKLGTSREIITSQLIGQGWKKSDIDSAFISLEIPTVSVPPVTSVPNPVVVKNSAPIVAPDGPIQKKSSKGLVTTLVILIVILMLIGAGFWLYFNFIAPRDRITWPTPAPFPTISTSTETVATTTVLNTITTVNHQVVSKQVKVLSTPTPTPVSVPLIPKPVVSNVPVLTWQSISNNSPSLCFTGSTSKCLPSTAGKGLIDLNGDGSVMLGATEYCQYLNNDGLTIAKSPQNIWRLPTLNEWNNISLGMMTKLYQANNANQITYWTSTVSISHPDQYNSFMITGNNTTMTSYDLPTSQNRVLCIKYQTPVK